MQLSKLFERRWSMVFCLFFAVAITPLGSEESKTDPVPPATDARVESKALPGDDPAGSAEVPETSADAPETSAEAGEEGSAEETATPSDTGEEETGGGDESTAKQDDSREYAPVVDALVAIQGDQKTGIGTLVESEGRVVVITATSALAGNNQMAVRTAKGDLVPVSGMTASRNKDLAMLIVGGDASLLPVAEAEIGAPMKSGTSLEIQTPHRAVEASTGTITEGRMPVQNLETFLFPGTPVVLNGKVVGVFSPAMNVFGEDEGSRSGKNGQVWSAGMVFLTPDTNWQSVNPLRLAAQERTLNEVAFNIRELGALMNVSSLSESGPTLQRLKAAQNRLREGILGSRDYNATDLASQRNRFVFSVTSFSSDILPTLVAASRDYYGYFQPEVEVLKELYRPVYEKVTGLKENPSKADTYAR